MKYDLRWTEVASFMTIGSGIQVILGYYLKNLRGCSVGITDAEGFM
jgi:hypothetical protein